MLHKYQHFFIVIFVQLFCVIVNVQCIIWRQGVIDSVVIFCLSVCLSVTLVDIVNLLSGLFRYLVSSSILVVKMSVKFFRVLCLPICICLLCLRN